MPTSFVDILQTMALTYQDICQGEDPWLPLGNFMNDFFGYHTDLREELLNDPIQEPANTTPEQHRWATFCAASVEYLCQKYDVPCPQWVHDSAYEKLPEPWFHSPLADKPRVRERLLRESPEPFARRNIFCSSRIFANKYEISEDLSQRRSA